jgi:uncharacterized protein
MSLFHATVPPLKKMLQNLDAWLDKAVAHGKARSFDPETLLTARLAPDQYNLTRQIQNACDSAKFAVARLTGKDAPKHPDTETTIEQLRARIKSVVEYLGTYKEADFAGTEDKLLELQFLQGKLIRGEEYLYGMQLPNFYFHLIHAYGILRHNGVDLGKRDFIGGLELRDK